MICPKCQANNNDQAKFCKKCGSQLGTGSTSQARQTSIECPNCHSANLTQARFCRSCGFALTNHPVAQPRGNQPGSAMQGYPMDPARRDGGRLSGMIEIANPEHPHCATILLLDVSGSMTDNKKIGQLNEGLRVFKEEVLKDELASRRIDIAVVTFGNNVQLVHPFSSIQYFEPPVLEANGETKMGHAILEAIDIIEQRKKLYREQGVDHFRPWIFMITDGEPTDMKPGDELWATVVNRLHENEANNRLMFFAVGVEPANMNMLTQLMPSTRAPMKLRSGNFREMFQWLSNSQEKIAKADLQMGEMVKLDSPVGWADVPAR